MRHRFPDSAAFRPLLRPQAAPLNASAFCVFPINLVRAVSGEPCWWQQYLYKAALEQAQEVVRPSLPERDLLGCWN